MTVLARVGGGDWEPIGTDDNAPYRVYHDVSGHKTGTPLEYRAILLDNAGDTRTSRVRGTEVPALRILLRTPGEGARVHGRVRLLARPRASWAVRRARRAGSANTDPERASQSDRFERRIANLVWTAIGADTSSPDYRAVDVITGLGLAEGAEIRYRAVLVEADGTEVPTRPRVVTVGPPPA